MSKKFATSFDSISFVKSGFIASQYKNLLFVLTALKSLEVVIFVFHLHDSSHTVRAIWHYQGALITTICHPFHSDFQALRKRVH